MKTLLGAIFILIGAFVFFLFFSPRTIILQSQPNDSFAKIVSLPAVPEASASSSSGELAVIRSANGDVQKQSQLPNPPAIAKAIYITGWSAGSYSKMTSLINIIESRGLNAVVIDIKDYSGYLSYAMDVPGVKASGAEGEIRIAKPNELIKRLHNKNIYVIGRVTVFQDPIFAKAHPELALKNKITDKVWLDNHKLAWLDPAGQPTWDYVVSIAKDALGRGFDEINFDYIRFASDGNLNAISFPFWDEKTPKHLVIKKFFAYLRENLPNAKLSADLFGLATIDTWDDLGIGQVLEDAYQYFDYVAPMVYPSHYAAGTLGYKNPADYPYEIIKYSMDKALERLKNYELGIMNNGTTTIATTTTTTYNSSFIIHNSKLRPWLQVFDLGAVYTPTMIQKEIQATEDAFASSSAQYGGWLLWDPANNYKNFK
ncbi:MAG: putative glycoside hydrolase [Candidatus Liptonbacteria bacterium]|nr:putative glycoside hydrolase [Candidatus Liptonbacteria bacterium]